MTDRTGVLAKSPLVMTLASIRFAPWTLISKNIDEIHDELRDILPLLQNVQVESIAPSGQAQGEPFMLWILMTGDRSLSVQLSQDQILLTSRHYTRYGDFSQLMERVLHALMPRIKFIHVTAMGVRYIDHIQPRETEQLEQYLHPTLLPPTFSQLERLGGDVSAAYSIDGKELRIRCNTRPGTMSLPQEVAATLAMMLAPGQPLEVKALLEKHALFDIDAIKTFAEPKRMDDQKEIIQNLWELHEAANTFFRRGDVFTDHAFRVWKGEV